VMGSLNNEGRFAEHRIEIPDSFDGGMTSFETPAHYAVDQVIGKGSYGIVCRGTNTRTGQRVAIKKVHGILRETAYSRTQFNSGDVVRVLREIQLMRMFRASDSILPLIDVFFGQNRPEDLYIVTLLMDADLARAIKHQPLQESQIKHIMAKILIALKDLHAAGVIHRDLKPANVLVNMDCTVRLCDFNLSRPIGDDSREMTDYVVTRYYRAPEILCRKSYNTAADIWAAGCIFVEMFTRVPLFKGKHTQSQLQEIARLFPLSASQMLDVDSCESSRTNNLQKLLPPSAFHFAMKMLQWDPDNRATAEELLFDPYLADVVDRDDLRRGGANMSELLVRADADALPMSHLRALVQTEVSKYNQYRRGEGLASP